MVVSPFLLPFAVPAALSLAAGAWNDLSFFANLPDDAWTYALLGASAIVIEELAPIFGGIAAHEGGLQIARVVLGVTLGGWISTSLLYLAGRARWGTIRRRFPKVRGAGTIALRAVGRKPIMASFLVRFAFGLRLVLPLACGAARVPAPTFLLMSFLGSALWSIAFTAIGYAAGEAAVRVVGHLGQAGEIIGALLVTGAVLAFVRWSRRRRMLKEARRQRVASMPPTLPDA
ncbi:MAG: DedA family protein [Gemmatimonadaceae bacterium]